MRGEPPAVIVEGQVVGVDDGDLAAAQTAVPSEADHQRQPLVGGRERLVDHPQWRRPRLESLAGRSRQIGGRVNVDAARPASPAVEG